jgi:hypothetical protein
MKMINLTNELKYPPRLKGILSTIHADIVTYAIKHYDGTATFKRRMVDYINSVSYHAYVGDSLPRQFVTSSGLAPIDMVDMMTCHDTIGGLFIPPTIKWDGIEIAVQDEPEPVSSPKQIEVVKNDVQPRQIIQTPTPATHLYLVPPKVPRFDLTQDPWFKTKSIEGECEIYKSLPLIPKRQIDITITTDVSVMTDQECKALFPNRTVRTRAEVMYQPIPNVSMNPDVGLLLPISDFTDDQVLDNIIKYPHIFRLKRLVNGELRSFYQDIEINGELHPVDEVIDSLGEFNIIPKDPEFIKEYVVRRYLLERDIRHIEHKYPIYGKLDPFLTLFTTPNIYFTYGYSDAVGLARKCVQCRVDYLKSRNPFLRSTYQPGTCIFAHRCQEAECDGSCPIYGETSYLMERNAIPMIPEVFGASDSTLEKALKLIRSKDNLSVEYTVKPYEASKIIAYCGICETWKGNAFGCSVYHLNYQKYIEDLKATWTAREIPEELSYQQIWSQKAKILIVSNFEYIKFDDFSAQTIMNLLYNRNEHQLKTIIVLSKNIQLTGSGAFFERMRDHFREVGSK